ncbi:MAG: phosphodiesterase [Rubrivivax sp.]|nr:phosphodiesterase [Rubrivivax sp.]
MTTLLAQITDLHIREPGRLAYGRLDTAPYLRAAVGALQGLRQRPDAVVLTGDLTDFGRADEYAHLAELLAPLEAAGLPLFMLPGNHDERHQLRRSFAHHGHFPDTEFCQYTAAVGREGLQLVCLDTVQAGKGHGTLCAARLRWLDDELARLAGQPVIVAMHHPPFATLIGHMDRLGIVEGVEEFSRIVAAHPNIERVICGHLHRTIYTHVGGRLASTAPSPAHQVCLDLAPDAASAWTLEPPGFHVHAWSGPGRLVTHVASIGEHPGPFPFHDGGKLID